MKACWVPCPCCENFWCCVHHAHAHDCPCPEISEWDSTPYAATHRLMLDLFSGLGGASAAMRQRDGWEVITVDQEASFHPDVVADMREFVWEDPSPTLVWASPPCTEFSRESMPWCRTGRPPDLSLVESARADYRACDPEFWVIENVRGAVPYLRSLLGTPRQINGPFFLWGNFPPFHCHVGFFKETLSSAQQARRAMIPWKLSHAMALACETVLAF